MPKRSAIAPAKGWPRPHSRFCTASARPNTSRPQENSRLIGWMKKPSARARAKAEQRDRATTDDDHERRAPARERGGRTKVACSGRHLHSPFSVREPRRCRPRCLLRGVNAPAWKSQRTSGGSFRNAALQIRECQACRFNFRALWRRLRSRVIFRFARFEDKYVPQDMLDPSHAAGWFGIAQPNGICRPIAAGFLRP